MRRAALLALALLPALAQAQTPESLQTRSLAADLRALVDSAHAAGRFDGAVMLWRGGRTASATAGFADRAAGHPWTLATRSPWCSITKLATAVATLQMVREGRLRLSDRADRWVPALAAGPPVTLRQLLTHTSGLPHDDAIAGYYQRSDAAAALDSALTGPRRAAPGTSFRYDNLDYVVLGRVLAAVDGGAPEAVLRRRVLAPLGLGAVTMAMGGEAIGYGVDSTGAATPEPLSARALAAFGTAGGLVGDVRDLLAFGRGLATGRLLPPTWVDALATVPLRGVSGLSVWTYTVTDAHGRRLRVLQRPGWIGGNRALLLVVPETGAVAAALANTDASDLGSAASGTGLPGGLLRLLVGG